MLVSRLESEESENGRGVGASRHPPQLSTQPIIVADTDQHDLYPIAEQYQ